MSKITNDGSTRSGTECFIAAPIWQQWASKGQWKVSRQQTNEYDWKQTNAHTLREYTSPSAAALSGELSSCYQLQYEALDVRYITTRLQHW